MTVFEIIITVAVAWAVVSSAVALALCARWKRNEELRRLQLRFDPVAVRGIERGDYR